MGLFSRSKSPARGKDSPKSTGTSASPSASPRPTASPLPNLGGEGSAPASLPALNNPTGGDPALAARTAEASQRSRKPGGFATRPPTPKSAASRPMAKPLPPGNPPAVAPPLPPPSAHENILSVTMRVGADGTFGINLQRAKQPSSSGHTPITVLNVDAESPNAPVLRSGDELISVAGENIRGNYDALMAQVRKHKPSGAIRCEVVRPHLSALELGASAASAASASSASPAGGPSAAHRPVAVAAPQAEDEAPAVAASSSTVPAPAAPQALNPAILASNDLALKIMESSDPDDPWVQASVKAEARWRAAEAAAIVTAKRDAERLAEMNARMATAAELHSACARGDVATAKELLQQVEALPIPKREQRMIVDWKDAKGWSALMHAAKKGHANACKAMLDANADPNLTNNNTTSPLMVACMWGEDRVVKVLLDAQADDTHVATLPPFIGMTALSIAREKQHTGCVRLLERHAAKDDTALFSTRLDMRDDALPSSSQARASGGPMTERGPPGSATSHFRRVEGGPMSHRIRQPGDRPGGRAATVVTPASADVPERPPPALRIPSGKFAMSLRSLKAPLPSLPDSFGTSLKSVLSLKSSKSSASDAQKSSVSGASRNSGNGRDSEASRYSGGSAGDEDELDADELRSTMLESAVPSCDADFLRSVMLSTELRSCYTELIDGAQQSGIWAEEEEESGVPLEGWEARIDAHGRAYEHHPATGLDRWSNTNLLDQGGRAGVEYVPAPHTRAQQEVVELDMSA